MRKLKTKALAVTAVCIAVIMSGCVNIRYASRLRTTVAEINGEKILLNNVDGQVNDVIDNLVYDYGENFEGGLNSQIKKTEGAEKKKHEGKKQALIDNRKKALNSLVKTKVLSIKGKQNKLNIDKEMKQAEDTLNQLKEKEITTYEYQGMSKDEAEKEYNKNERFIIGRYCGVREYPKVEFMESRRISAFAQEMEAKIRDSIDVTDEDIKKYYNDNRKEYVKEAGYDVRELFFPIIDGNKDNAKKAAQDTFKTILDDTIDMDSSFMNIFNSTLSNGTKLGKEGKMIAQSNTIVLSSSNRPDIYVKNTITLGPECISEPICTDNGCYIVDIVNKRTADEIRPLENERADIIEKIKDKRKEAVVKKKIEEYKKELNLKIYEDRLSF